ncbi:CapA family protein [Desertibacillus haloalkaliphilus]|uniref:CapA family protein n=1 Tax=Desertibacillus haloalkaliphilus TaxID=1328930 RepID=UPI001C27208F|nr:CapA family protein [Desertibacillus haloalkaliphilus]MBU8905058.1 CapA family protein [Desertibacillus haloalkaliphilus]
MKKLYWYQLIVFTIAFVALTSLVVLYDTSREAVTETPYDTEEEYEEEYQEETREDVPVEEVIEVEEPIEPIEIIFAGDLMMSGSIEYAVQEFSVDYPFEFVKEEVQNADFAVVNLETAVTERTDAFPKQFAFKMPPHFLEGVKNAGFDMVSLANNHTMDFKEAGLVDTIEHLQDYEIAHIGAGRNKKEAYAANVIEINDESVAFLGFSRVLPDVSWYAGPDKPGIASGYQLDRMERIIAETAAEADYVLVYIHWGSELAEEPEPYQIEYAEVMINAGADAIVGTHPHVLQPIEEYNGKPIAYSLGNFLFPDYVSGPTAETGLLKLILDDGDINVEFSEYLIEGNQVVEKE